MKRDILFFVTVMAKCCLFGISMVVGWFGAGCVCAVVIFQLYKNGLITIDSDNLETYFGICMVAGLALGGGFFGYLSMYWMYRMFHRVDTNYKSPERVWKRSMGEKRMGLVHGCFDMLKSINERFKLKYYHYYICLSDGDKEIDYIFLFPANANLIDVALNINNRDKRISDIVIPKPEDSFINFRLTEGSIKKNRVFLKELFSLSYQKYIGAI
jgi:hypothetical protein